MKKPQPSDGLSMSEYIASQPAIPAQGESLITASAIPHLPIQCGSRKCAQHRDTWRHYEDHIAASSASGYRAGLEAAATLINAVKQNAEVARDRAAAAGRESVSSHRQSDVETCERIIDRIRALAPAEDGGNHE